MARTEDVQLDEETGHLIVFVPELAETFVLPSLTASVWRHSDGRSTISDIARQVSTEFKNNINEETIWSALDCLAEARLLRGWAMPPTAARRDLMYRRALQAGLCLATIHMIHAVSTGASQVIAVANGEQEGKENKAKEEGRKQEEGGKEKNQKWMEQDGKRQAEWADKERGNKQEQADKERARK